MGYMRLFAMITGLFAMTQTTNAADTPSETAIFAGGCFWCIEAELDELDGVHSAVSGFIGGHVDNPSYEDAVTGKTGHAEAVEVTYDPTKISYQQLLDVFWSNIDPTDAGGQFYDRGSQYRTGIFYMNDEQKALAEQSKADKETLLGQLIATEITKADTFYAAEEYHQDYYKKNPLRYNAYKIGSGRKETLKKVWGE